MTDNKRIKSAINWLKSQNRIDSQKVVGEKLGITNRSYLSQLVNSTEPNPEFINKFTALFPEISKEWLLTGEGEMMVVKENSENNSVEDEMPLSEDSSMHTDDVNTLIRKRQSNPRMIPFYDAESTGGYNGRVSSSNIAVKLQGYINAGDWFSGRETAAIRHVGDSMIEYPDGCVLAVKEVKELRLLVPGRNYVVETDEYRITKRIQKGHSAEYIALYSSNQEKYDDGRLRYEPFEVMLCDVRRIYSILGYIVNQSGEARLITP